MVKYCSAMMTCKICLAMVGIKTSIMRNKGIEKEIHKGSCDHFLFSIDTFTRNTFSLFGSPDEIAVTMRAKCRKCDKSLICNTKCKGVYVSEGHFERSCHVENAIEFYYEYSANSTGEIIKNLGLFSAVVMTGPFMPITFAAVTKASKSGQHLKFLHRGPSEAYLIATYK